MTRRHPRKAIPLSTPRTGVAERWKPNTPILCDPAGVNRSPSPPGVSLRSTPGYSLASLQDAIAGRPHSIAGRPHGLGFHFISGKWYKGFRWCRHAVVRLGSVKNTAAVLAALRAAPWWRLLYLEFLLAAAPSRSQSTAEPKACTTGKYASIVRRGSNEWRGVLIPSPHAPPPAYRDHSSDPVPRKAPSDPAQNQFAKLRIDKLHLLEPNNLQCHK